MATAAVPRARRSLLGKAASAVIGRARTRGRAGRLAAFATAAREHVMTAAALASADFGAFHYGPGVGWLVTGFSLLVLDFAVTG